MRGRHPVVVGAVGGVACLFLGILAPARAQPQSVERELEVYDVVPADLSVRLRAGQRQQFSIWVAGEGLHYLWMLDGGPVGERHSWTFFPDVVDVGSHRVTVAVDGPDGRVRRTWLVDVGPAVATTVSPPTTGPLPTLAPAVTTSARPSTSTTSTSSTMAQPSTSTTSTTSTTARPTTLAPTTTTRRPTTTTRRPTTTTTARPTTTSTERSTTTTTATLALSTTTVPARGGITEGDVRALLERYKAAWRAHDIAGLEAVGQVSTQGQIDALKSYFESVRDLDVDVTILAITPGDEATVRFVRRDRFRDPAGNVVVKESPVIEKLVVRTPGGLRLSPLR